MPFSRPWNMQQWRLSGAWEPKMFLLRRGDGTLWDVEKMWQETHSDEDIARMKSLGINLRHIHFHKGYGLEHERESIAEAAAYAARLHEHGIRVGVYIGCTFFPETFKHPHYEKMIQKNDHFGWGGAQYFRKHWCYNSPYTREYFKEVIRLAIEEVQADVLHFDHSWSFYHDKLCHCEYCLAGFHKFISEEIPEIVRAAGYDRPELLSPPPVGNLGYLATVTELREPGAIAWLLYHAHAGVEAMRFFVDYARSLKRDVGILFNGATLCGIPPFARAENSLIKLRLADMSAVEDSLENPPGLSADGMPISRFRPYKAGLRAKCRIMCYTVEKGYKNRLMLAESAAFNYLSLGCVEMVQQPSHRITEPGDEAMLRYLVANEELFLDRQPWWHVAVLRHHASELLNPFPCALTPYVVEQMLFEHHIPFGIISESELHADLLAREFDLLILPESKCLSDGEISEIEQFISGGGRLLSIGKTATATPLNQFRATWGLGRIFGRSASPQETRNSANSGARIEASFGDGRAIHILALDLVLPEKGEVHSWAGYPWYYHPYWRAPRNAGIFLAALNLLIGEEWRIKTDLPRTVGMECFTNSDGYSFCFVNYAEPTYAPKSMVAIRLGEAARRVTSVRWFSPDGNATIKWDLCEGEKLRIALPSFSVLGVLNISCS